MALTPTRSETAANWITSDTILAMNEVAIASDTGVVKVGDGITHYTKLAVAANQETSADKRAATSDETGTGAAVYATSPTLTTPVVSGGTFTSPSTTGELFSAANAITASAAQTQAAGTVIAKDINRVVTVASANDAVTLPSAVAGLRVTIINAHATNAIKVFPFLTNAINALGTDAAYALAATKVTTFFCAVAGTWNAQLGA